MKMFSKFMLMFIIFTITINAQNQSGVRYINKNMFSKLGLWFDSSNSMYQEEFPIIQNIPPLSTGMPFDVLLGYIYLDSLLKYTTDDNFNAQLNAMNSLNDTIKSSMKYLYKIKDYNPSIFKQYISEVWLHQKRIKHLNYRDTTLQKLISGSYTEIYSANLDAMEFNSTEKFRNLIVNDTIKKALYSMVYSDYILRAEIISIDSTANKYVSTPGEYRYRVTANIKEIFKGQVLNCLNINNLINKHNSDKNLQNGICNIHFQYLPIVYTFANPNDPNCLYSNKDTNFTDNRGLFHFNVGQEAIIFLRYENARFDTLADYFDLDVAPRCSLNALPIINNTVCDVNHVWSQNDMIDLINWRNIYNNLKNKINNMSY